MNLATRRMNDPEFRSWLSVSSRKSWCFRVSDRFGDSGITGMLSIEQCGGVAEIRDFLLSCRVIGRKVEETMIHFASRYARSEGLTSLRAEYVPTPKNQPCLEFLKRSGFNQREPDRIFVWNLERDFPLPGAVASLDIRVNQGNAR
jgi:FkbH-like protein